MKDLLEDLVITIVVAVLICVFSVVPSQAVEPQNKGQATAVKPFTPDRFLGKVRELLDKA